MSVLGTIFSLATPLIMGQLMDNVLIGRNTQLLVPILFGMSAIFLVSALSNYLSNNIRGRLNLVLFKELAHDLFGVIQDASFKDLQKIKTGDLLTRTIVNTNVAVQTITSIIPQIVVTIFHLNPAVLNSVLNKSITCCNFNVPHHIVYFLIFLLWKKSKRLPKALAGFCCQYELFFKRGVLHRAVDKSVYAGAMDG